MLIDIDGTITDTIWIVKISPLYENTFHIYLAITNQEDDTISIYEENKEKLEERREKLIQCWLDNVVNRIEGENKVIKI